MVSGDSGGDCRSRPSSPPGREASAGSALNTRLGERCDPPSLSTAANVSVPITPSSHTSGTLGMGRRGDVTWFGRTGAGTAYDHGLSGQYVAWRPVSRGTILT